jgi:hypothetical protein
MDMNRRALPAAGILSDMAHRFDHEFAIPARQRYQLGEPRNLDEREKLRRSIAGLGDVTGDHDRLLLVRAEHAEEGGRPDASGCAPMAGCCSAVDIESA